MEYMTVKEAALQWNISPRLVQKAELKAAENLADPGKFPAMPPNRMIPAAVLTLCPLFHSVGLCH